LGFYPNDFASYWKYLDIDLAKRQRGDSVELTTIDDPEILDRRAFASMDIVGGARYRAPAISGPVRCVTMRPAAAILESFVRLGTP
jgi:hypothetical protein